MTYKTYKAGPTVLLSNLIYYNDTAFQSDTALSTTQGSYAFLSVNGSAVNTISLHSTVSQIYFLNKC